MQIDKGQHERQLPGFGANQQVIRVCRVFPGVAVMLQMQDAIDLNRHGRRQKLRAQRAQNVIDQLAG